MTRFLQTIGLAIAMVCSFLSLPSAREVAPGHGDTLLEITDFTSGGTEVAIQLDLTALEALQSSEIVTSTLWTDGVHRFQGVPIRQLLTDLNLQARQLRAVAINDYVVDFPLDDGLTEHAIVAYRMNGDLMSRRAKGPLWIIYPFDQSSKFRTETIYARSVWQLNRIEVID